MVKITNNYTKDSLETIISSKLVNYEESLTFMESRVDGIINNEKIELIWLLEHPSIYTFGNTSNKNDFIKKPKIPVFKTNRGGQITYHGPGQRIIYFMINLKNKNKDVRYFINLIEKIAITTLNEFGIEAESRRNRVGIWVTKYQNIKLKKEKKIGSIGIRLKKWVTYHGLSININPNLKYYKNINPCGIKNYETTSIKELGIDINIEKFDQILLKKAYEYLNQ